MILAAGVRIGGGSIQVIGPRQIEETTGPASGWKPTDTSQRALPDTSVNSEP
jgi:hypothetical protein